MLERNNDRKQPGEGVRSPKRGEFLSSDQENVFAFGSVPQVLN